MKKAGLEIYSDGGARGNPGPGACAFVAKKGNEVLAQGAKFLGSVTNNFAEYSGVILALEWLTEQSPFRGEGLSIDFYLDSELVAKQLGGEYRVKNQTLKKLTLAQKEIIIKDDLT